jgi:formate--tetrahydrofolate ligase
MNDRALRGWSSTPAARPSATRFDITAASEVMAILALATSLDDLRARLARTVVGGPPTAPRDRRRPRRHRRHGRAAARGAAPQPGADREGAPALVHAGPFANIAHGCSSVLATDLGLHHADVVVTEAGFGFDLGGEKFLHLKAPQAGLWPRCVVLVATVRRPRSHGGGDLRPA